MRLNRYKAKFTGAASHHSYSKSSGWLFGAHLIACAVIFILTSPCPASLIIDSYVFRFMTISLLPLFALKLFAQDYNKCGLLLGVSAGIFGLYMILGAMLSFDISEMSSAIVGAIYYGGLALITLSEYSEQERVLQQSK